VSYVRSAHERAAHTAGFFIQHRFYIGRCCCSARRLSINFTWVEDWQGQRERAAEAPVIAGHKQLTNWNNYAFDCPEGTWTATLEQKAWGKSSNLILCFADAATGKQYRLSVFSGTRYKGSLHESALSVRHLGTKHDGLRVSMSASPFGCRSGGGRRKSLIVPFPDLVTTRDRPVRLASKTTSAPLFRGRSYSRCSQIVIPGWIPPAVPAGSARITKVLRS
jgi:hypothetical protein